VPARTGEQYLKDLEATKREVWIGGERIDSVVDHPFTAQAARSMAAWFDLQFAYPNELLVSDEETGEPINASHMIPRSKDDLRRREMALRRISELSMGTMGRLPEYINVTFAGFAGSMSDWKGRDESNEEGAARLVEFQKRHRRNDLAATHTIIHPTVDKMCDGFVDNPVPLHKVGETKEGIVVRGARVLATLAPFSDEQTVYPGHPIPANADPSYALAFTVRMDTPGMIFLCRDPGARPAIPPFDAPFSTQFDEQDAFCIFDDVEIPKENVWVDGNLDVYNDVVGHSWSPNILQQATIRALTKLEFSYGLANRMAEIVNDQTPATQELLGELGCYVELTRNALLAATERAITNNDGLMFLDPQAITPIRCEMPAFMTRAVEIIRIIGSHNLLATASRGQLGDVRLRPLIDQYLRGANGIDAEERSIVFRAAWDFIGSALGSRNDLYERNYLASARTNRLLFQARGLSSLKDRGNELLDKLLDGVRASS
jgi:4-hydroxyphenylacetate 3-monooxygenase